MITLSPALRRLEILSGLLERKPLFVRLVTFTTSGDVAIIFRLSPGYEQSVRKDTDVAHRVVVADK